MGIDKNKWFADSFSPCRIEAPGEWSHEFVTEMYLRYCLTLQYANEASVLDAGCGVCHGSSLLSMRAKNVVCANISKDEMDYGNEFFRFYCPTEFVQCNLDESFPDGRFDLVVSFECIEHLSKPEFFINNVKNNLNDGGRFIFSVPRTLEQQRYWENIRIGHRYNIQTFKQVQDMFSTFSKINWCFQMEGLGGIIGEKYMTGSKDMVKSWIGVCSK